MLGGQNGKWPIVQLRINLLHLEVGALHHANFERCATCFDSGRSKTLDSLHGSQCLWEVSLQHNSSGVGAQALVAQHTLEHIKCHVEVFEFLHVQVDERGWVGGCCFGVEGISRVTTRSTVSLYAHIDSWLEMAETFTET